MSKLRRFVLLPLLIFLLVAVGTYLVLSLSGQAPEQEDELDLTELESGEDYLEDSSEEDYLAESTDDLLENSFDLESVEEDLDSSEELEQDLSSLIREKERQFNLRLEDDGLNYSFDGSIGELKTTLILEAYYQDCGTLHREEKEIAAEKVLSQLATRYQDWQVVESNEQEVVLRKELAGNCPEHQVELYLGIEDGFVAIFSGPPGSEEATLQRQTEISIEYLPPSEIKSLEAGIKAESEEELLGLLEGLASIHDERME
ncbi:BofC C-terminal domain-containing protein [Fuchsiella alkaliacetigena]|uniref:BofC C-terminal domain-containing protein n=1 Tax=Fuchsiella alkaliacetigena TaxID=957042 RepID=UPI00200A7A26|nr:BofC C-terminal domain-containing protein [Fuchsiella alkaliacetigena]MCK8825210.1 BofC C-terminal domain-containing protein [Fuchsiella alkaliacetigena]